MNLSLLDPFQNDFPEVIEEYLDDKPCRCLAFNRRGSLLAAGCLDGSCVVWDFETRGVAKELVDAEACSAPITSVSWSKCGRKLLAAASTQGRVVLWDVLSGTVSDVLDFGKNVMCAHINPRAPSIFVACPMGSPPVLVDFRRKDKQVVLPLSAQPEKGSSHAAAGAGASGAKGKNGKGQASRKGKGVNAVAGPSQGTGASALPTPAAFHRDGEIIALGNASGKILLVHGCRVLRKRSSADGHVLASPTVLASISVPGGSCIKQLSFTRDCQFLLVNSADRVLRVYRIEMERVEKDISGSIHDPFGSAAKLAGEQGGRREVSGETVRHNESRSADAVSGKTEATLFDQEEALLGGDQQQISDREAQVQEPILRETAGSESQVEGAQHAHEREFGVDVLELERPATPANKAASQGHNRETAKEEHRDEKWQLADDGGVDDERCLVQLRARVMLSKEFQDAVNRVQWRSACFSGDGEFVLAGAATRGEHKIHIWHREYGQLVRILDGPTHKDNPSVVEVLWHPIQKIAVSVAASGVVYIWAQDYRESWSAFAPDFRELEENEEYVEREDEFDLPEEGALENVKPAGKAEKEAEQEEDVDVEEVERVGAYSDSDASEDGLLFLPASPIQEKCQAPGGAQGEAAEPARGRADNGTSAVGDEDAAKATLADQQDAAGAGQNAEHGDERNGTCSQDGEDQDRGMVEEVDATGVGEAGPAKKPQRKRRLSEKGAMLEAERSANKRKTVDSKKLPLNLAKKCTLEPNNDAQRDASPAPSTGVVSSQTGSEAVLDVLAVDVALVLVTGPGADC